jgi:hypothetical protein
MLGSIFRGPPMICRLPVGLFNEFEANSEVFSASAQHVWGRGARNHAGYAAVLLCLVLC